MIDSALILIDSQAYIYVMFNQARRFIKHHAFYDRFRFWQVLIMNMWCI